MYTTEPPCSFTTPWGLARIVFLPDEESKTTSGTLLSTGLDFDLIDVELTDFSTTDPTQTIVGDILSMSISGRYALRSNDNSPTVGLG